LAVLVPARALDGADQIPIASPWPGSFSATHPTTSVHLVVNGYPTTTNEIPVGIYQGLSSALNTPSSPSYNPTLPGYPSTALSGYVQNASTGAGQSAVGLYGVCGAASGANGFECYGANTVVSNQPLLAYSANANTGADFGTFLTGQESDMNVVAKPGGLAPAGTARAFVAAGASQTRPTGGANAYAVDQYGFGGVSPVWNNGFITLDGVAETALYAGAVYRNMGATTSDSQSIYFASYNAGAINRSHIEGIANGDLKISPASGVIDLNAGTYTTQTKGPVSLASGSYIASVRSASYATLEPLEINATQLLIDGGVTVGNVTNKGAGTINVAGGYYINGTQVTAALSNASLTATPTNPHGTTSAGGVMMGLGTSCNITPAGGSCSSSTAMPIIRQMATARRYGSRMGPAEPRETAPALAVLRSVHCSNTFGPMAQHRRGSRSRAAYRVCR
jgi:hypothetical protein